MLKGKKLAVVGVGKLGESLLQGLLASGRVSAADVSGSVAHEASVGRVSERLAISVSLDNAQTVAGRQIVILAVKPQNMQKVLGEINAVVTEDQLIISVAASISTRFVEERLAFPCPVVRAMPNTPAVVNEAMTALAGGRHAGEHHLAAAEEIFSSIGKTVFLDEALMDGVTALSASGPAYLYVVIESLAEAGVKLGIPRDVSTFLAAQTMLGSARMILESKAHPALLKDMVTTPAGCTIDGLLELEEGKLRVTLIKAVVKAAERAAQLVRDEDKSRG